MAKSKLNFLRWIHLLLALGGLTLLGWMIHKIGWQTILNNLQTFGVGPTLFLILLYSIAQMSFCAGWYVCILDHDNRVHFWHIFTAYLTGDAINMTVPSANLAGEPVKVLILKERIPIESALSSVTVYKFTDLLAMTLFLLIGWLFHFPFYTLPISWNIAAGVVISGMTGISIVLYFLQKRGIYHPTSLWLKKLGLENLIFGKLEAAHLIDQRIGAFYHDHPRRFFLSLFYNFCAWFGGVLEIVLFMKWSGIEASFPAALTIETFSLFINNVIFFVPARVGVVEGGRVLLFLTLGYAPSLGLSYGILRRIRECVWIGVGLLILLLFKRGKIKPDPA